MTFLSSFTSGDSSDCFGRNFIGNSFVESICKKVYTRYCPYDCKPTGVYADSIPEDVEVATKLAHDAFKLWSKTSNEYRADLLKKLSDLLSKCKREMAEIITREMGKPISESLMEIDYSTQLLNWYCGEAKRIHGQIFSVPGKKKMFVTYKPHGVVGLITPWNFPLSTAVIALGALLGAGCTCVYKPCPEAPLTALLLAKLTKEAGFPTGVFNVITANYVSTPAIGTILCTHSLIRHITFIGSIEVGKILMAQSASTVKRLTMELGGNAPALIFNTANIEQTIKNLILAKFLNSGQVCISPNRIFVQNEIYDKFMEALIDGVSKLKGGAPMDQSTQISGLYDKKGFDKVMEIVDLAQKEGAMCTYQGPKLKEGGPFYYPPTILTGCKFDMSIFQCEIFGPVCPIFRFETESDVFGQMNRCAHGLAAYIYSNDMNQVFRTVEELQFGLVAINELSPDRYFLPFGGQKESGIGSLSGTGSIYSYCDTQSVVLDHE